MMTCDVIDKYKNLFFNVDIICNTCAFNHLLSYTKFLSKLYFDI